MATGRKERTGRRDRDCGDFEAEAKKERRKVKVKVKVKVNSIFLKHMQKE
jgi:hypothetical protein